MRTGVSQLDVITNSDEFSKKMIALLCRSIGRKKIAYKLFTVRNANAVTCACACGNAPQFLLLTVTNTNDHYLRTNLQNPHASN